MNKQIQKPKDLHLCIFHHQGQLRVHSRRILHQEKLRNKYKKLKTDKSTKKNNIQMLQQQPQFNLQSDWLCVQI